MEHKFEKKQDNQDSSKDKENGFESQTLLINRVAKVVKGGKRMKFQALVVLGNRKGKVGIALGKGRDPRLAIEKATTKAKKKMLNLNLNDGTIQFEVLQKFKSSKIFLKPARRGVGIISSNALRPIFELAGITDIYSKIYGTNNKLTNAYCVFEAFEKLNN